MITVKYRCPFSKEIINENNQIGSYIRWGVKHHNISCQELRYKIYLETFGNIVSYDIFSKYYKELKYSFPMFKSEFGIGYKVTDFLITYHKIQSRTMGEACKLGAVKTKKTNLNRYGVDQTFKVKEFDDKRKKTYLEKYGVDNPFKIKNFLESVESSYQEKYGCSMRERRSQIGKSIWANMSPEVKADWLKKTLLSDSCWENRRTTTEGNCSQLEINIRNVLSENAIKYETQFSIKPYLYDLYLKDINTIIEVNGTLWHADPTIYDKDDLIPRVNKKAEEIWLKDQKKFDLAKSLGYRIIIIWERELYLQGSKEVLELIYFKIHEDTENQKREKIIETSR